MTRWTSQRDCRAEPAPEQRLADRRGAIMLLVLAAIVLLSFAAYTFAELMLNEHTAARAMSQHLELRCLAESGVEATAAWIDGRPRRDAEPPGWFQSPQLFAKQPAPAGMSGLGHYSIVPDLAALNCDQAVFGL